MTSKQLTQKDEQMMLPKLRRKFIRFPAGLNEVALIIFVDMGGKIKQKYVALVVNESRQGCSLISIKHPEIRKDALCYVQIGQLNAIPSIIRWVKKNDEKSLTIGVEFDVEA